MTLSNDTNKNQYIANGSNTIFGYGFKINASNEVTVILTDTTGTDIPQVETTNYTVSGVGVGTGGNITFVTAPTNLYTITLVRNVPITQTTDFIDNNSFASSAPEDGLDKTVMIAQKQQEELDRSIKVRTSTSTTFSPVIDLTGGAGKHLRVKTDGSGIELVEGTVTAGSGLGSVDGVSNSGGNIDLTSTDATVTITPNDSANTIDFSASASQPFSSLNSVTNPAGNVDIVAGTAMTVTPNDTSNQITVDFSASGLADNSISGNKIDAGTISNFASTGIDDNATATKITLIDTNLEVDVDTTLKSTSPILNYEETDGAVDEKVWRMESQGGIFSIQTLTDVFTAGLNALRMLRTGTTVDEVELNATLVDINGNVDMSGTVDCSGTESFKLPAGTTAQRPSVPTNGDTRYNSTTNKSELYENGVWVDITTSAVAGEANTASNVGTGVGTIFKAKTGVDLELKTILAGANITVTNNVSDITIAASGTAGETNTASNVGTGTGTIFKQKTGVDLELKTILAGSGISLTNNVSDITLALSSGSSIINVKDKGAVGDGVTDDLAAINSAITDAVALADGGVVYFPSGNYRVTGTITKDISATPAVSLVFKGDSPEMSTVFADGAFDAFNVNIGASGGWDAEKSAVGWQDMTISTSNAGTVSAVKLNNTAGVTSAAPVKFFKNLVLDGNAASKYWGIGLELIDCSFVDMQDVKHQGLASSFGGTAIDISGANSPVDLFIRGLRCFHSSTMVNVTGTTEGVYINQSIGVIVDTGIRWNTTAGEPLLLLTNCHINARKFCVNATNILQTIITSNLLYQNTNVDTQNWVAVNINGVSSIVQNASQINSNIIAGFGLSGSKNGIVLSNFGYSNVYDNRIENIDTGVWLQTGADNNIVLDNHVTTFASFKILDSGSNNTVRQPDTISAFRGAMIYRTTAQSISNSTWTQITFNATDYDTSSLVSGSNRMTVPTGVTRVRVSTQVAFAAQPTDAHYQLNIKKNGTSWSTGAATYAGNGRSTYSGHRGAGLNVTTPVLTVVAGDFFEVETFQNTGTSLNIANSTREGQATWFAMEIVE